MSDNVLDTDPEQWTPEALALAKEKLAATVARFRKARGEVPVKAPVKKKPKGKSVKGNLDLTAPVKGS